MKIGYVWVALAVAITSQVAAAELAMTPSPEDKEAALWTERVLERYRYKPEGPAQAGGEKAFERYLDALDANRVIFTQEDIAALEPRLSTFGKIDGGTGLDVSFEMFASYRARLVKMVEYAKSVLHQPLDFKGTQRFQRVRANAARAGSEAALRDLWRQRVVDDYLSLRLAGCPEKDIIPTLERRYDKILARARGIMGAQVFQIFMNAYTQSLDPDSSYMLPSAVAVVTKPISLVGIGIVVQKKDDLIVVREQVHGGVAERSGLLRKGDRIVGIAQGAGQPFTSVIGWDVDDAVDLMRGVQDSTLVLDVLPAGAPVGGARKRVPLVRTPVRVSQDMLASRIEVLARGGSSYRIGVIVVPPFYQDFAAQKAGAKDFRSMSRDVAQQLQAFRIAKVDGVLLDLRHNGGGALDEATRLAGLFLPGDPVSQQRGADGKVTAQTAADGISAWDGVLGVLIDKGSAAAAEIFAAAIQDYGRGIVIGDTSFGRATVQTLIPLDRFATHGEHLGELKMTIAQMYRVDGTSFQQRGVTPDILVPGEAGALRDPANGSAYLAAPIKAVAFKKTGEVSALLPALAARHSARTLADPRYRAMLDARTEAEAKRDKDEVSLNESERRKVHDTGVPVDIGQVQLDESLQILGDEIELLRKDPALAKRAGVVPAAAP